MFCYLAILVTGCLCHTFADAPEEVFALENQTATLSCPHAAGGEVRWSRYRNGQVEELLTIKDGKENKRDKRYSSLADNKSLVITRVKESDTTMYLCNGIMTVYLNVTTDHKLLVRNDGPRSGHGPNQKGTAPVEDENETDLWKVPVGVVIGAALVLLAILTLRFCSKKRAVKNTNVDKTVSEVIYEEIKDSEIRPRRESGIQSPYYWTNVTETAGMSTPPNDKLYATVNKLKTKGRSNEACVYYLAQNPRTTGNDS